MVFCQLRKGVAGPESIGEGCGRDPPVFKHQPAEGDARVDDDGGALICRHFGSGEQRTPDRGTLGIWLDSLQSGRQMY